MDCSICLERIPAKSAVVGYYCNHSLHRKCFKKWNRIGVSGDRCPTCRAEKRIYIPRVKVTPLHEHSDLKIGTAYLMIQHDRRRLLKKIVIDNRHGTGNNDAFYYVKNQNERAYNRMCQRIEPHDLPLYSFTDMMRHQTPEHKRSYKKMVSSRGKIYKMYKSGPLYISLQVAKEIGIVYF